MTDTEAPKCRAKKPRQPDIRCEVDLRLSKPDDRGRTRWEPHKGAHGAYATNPGQWLGNKQPLGLATKWGDDGPETRTSLKRGGPPRREMKEGHEGDPSIPLVTTLRS